jgi:hypothetical protein
MDEALIIQRFREGLEKLVEAGKIELTQQGHRATGSLVESLEAKIISEDLDKLVGVIMAEDYGLIVDQGVKASRVPFSGTGGSGENQRSKYIEALLRWAQIVRPSLREKERKSFVFAVAHKHRKEGIPTGGSFSFSQNNRRTNWIRYGIEEFVPALEGDLRLFDLMSRILEKQIDEALQ